MIAVIFEVEPAAGSTERYLELAADLRPLLDGISGFISIERFVSMHDPERILSLSFWRDEASVAQWRQLEAHRAAQHEGRAGVFQSYRLRIADVVRDYGLDDRDQAPVDSRIQHS